MKEEYTYEIQRKVTSWEKDIYKFYGTKEECDKKALKTFEESDYEQNFIDNQWEGFIETQCIIDTIEDMYVEDNQGNSTRELFDEKGNTLAENSNDCIKENVLNLNLSTLSKLWKELYGEDFKKEYSGIYQKLLNL